MKIGRHEVPDFWQWMLPEDFAWLRAPDEKLATCHDCYNVRIGEAAPGCQCCTYYPEIPNFLLGAALADEACAGQVRSLLSAGHGLPTGLAPSPRTYVRAVEAHAHDTFGKQPEMRCPFMDAETNDCGVYGYRNSVCSTFFCTHDHDEAGGEYWGHVQNLVGVVEVSLSQWAMQAQGLSPEAYFARLDGWAGRLGQTETADGSWSPEARADLWGPWFGREEAFYLQCAESARRQGQSLFERATEQRILEPLVYDRAVRASVPEDARDFAPHVPEEQREHEGRVTDLWYRLQLASRQLWAVPFGEGAAVLAPDVRIEPNDTSLPVLGASPFAAYANGSRLGLTAAEAAALRTFGQPRPLDETLMESAEMRALDDRRASLSQWFRRHILVLSGST